MSIKEDLLKEFKVESASTRKILERVPEQSFSWKPHEKSMALGTLAFHLAEIYQWAAPTINADELDFAKRKYVPPDFKTTKELLEFYDKNTKDALELFENADEEEFNKNWTMRMGDKIFFTRPKKDVLRSFIMNHSIHHRAQLTVYLRLLDVPLPSIYGPTADEPI